MSEMSNIERLKELTTKLNNAILEYETVFDSEVFLICETNKVGKFTRISKAWTNVLGWSIEEMYEHPFTYFIHPDDVEQTMKLYTDLVNHRTSVKNFVNRYKTKNDGYVSLIWASPGFNKGESLIATAIVCPFDINIA